MFRMDGEKTHTHTHTEIMLYLCYTSQLFASENARHNILLQHIFFVVSSNSVSFLVKKCKIRHKAITDSSALRHLVQSKDTKSVEGEQQNSSDCGDGSAQGR